MKICGKYLPLGLLIVAVILDIIAIAIPYWSVSDDKNTHKGLWKVCTGGKCVDMHVSDDLKKMRGLHMGALVGALIALIIYIVSEFVNLLSPKMRWRLVSLFCIKTGAFIMIADSYMANHWKLYPACHVVSLVSAALFLVLGGFFSSSNNPEGM